MPKCRKFGLLMSEIYWGYNSTSTTKDLNNALNFMINNITIVCRRYNGDRQ